MLWERVRERLARSLEVLAIEHEDGGMGRQPLVLGAIGLVLAASVSACGSSSHSSKPHITRASTPPSAPVSLPQLIGRVRTGIVRIESTFCDGSGVGTGFLLDAHDVATVDHVVDA